jgi:hypothetical protein
MEVILQQLKKHGLLNNLFMVEARVNDKMKSIMTLVQLMLPTQVGVLERWMSDMK